MQAPTDVRASAKTDKRNLPRSTSFSPIPQVTTCVCKRLYYLIPGEQGKKPAHRVRADDLDPRRLATIPIGEIPSKILPLVAAKEIGTTHIILYARKDD